MKDLKSLKPTEICIRATKENAEFIIPLLEKLGGVGANYLKDISNEIGNCFAIINGSIKWIVWITDREEKNYTEITLEQLRELAGVKEPQTERITLKDTGWMPTFREEANEHLKQLLTFQTDLNEHINSVVQKLATLEAVKSENESLKECLKGMRRQLLVLIAGHDGITDAHKDEYGEKYKEAEFVTKAKEFIAEFDSKHLIKP